MCSFRRCPIFLFFFFNDTATTEIYTLSLHDALPISPAKGSPSASLPAGVPGRGWSLARNSSARSPANCPSERPRSEEHTSELQSPDHLVCRLLLEKKKKNRNLNDMQSRSRTYTTQNL